MKRIFQHPTGTETGKAYWRSLDELEKTPQFKEALEREFPAGAQELELDGLSRRSFLRLMGASVALAGVGLTSCRRPELHTVPYTNTPEWIVDGKSLQFATAIQRRSGAIPLLVTSYEGRPTHLQGNTSYPGQTGGLDVLAQASVLDLYDPNRARSFTVEGKEIDLATFAQAIQKIGQDYTANQGAGLAILTEPSSSPTRARLQAELQQKFPKMVFATYDPLGNQNRYEAAAAVLKQRVNLQPQYDKADTILAIESDFCSGQEDGVGAIRGFASRRRVGKPGDEMNRLYVVESRFTRTGGMADHRLRLPASHMGAFLVAIAQELSHQGVAGLELEGVETGSYQLTDVQAKWVQEFAIDFVRSSNPLIVVGRQQPFFVQYAALLIIKQLGALNKTIKVLPAFESQSSSIEDLAAAIQAKQVQTLITIGVNPVYATPNALNWRSLHQQVPHTIHLSHGVDETAQLSSVHGPLTHYLESWGDALSEDGVYLTVQPLILPLFGAVSEIELYAALLGDCDALKPYDYPSPAAIAKPHLPGKSSFATPVGLKIVKATFTSIYSGASLEADWAKALHDGYSTSVRQPVVVLDGSKVDQAASFSFQLKPLEAGKLEVSFYACPKVDDGRYANNGWLQELPDFTTKITWDNAALISPATAKSLGITTGQIIVIQTELGELKIVANVTPGQADGSIAVALGYGRTDAGHVGNDIGFNSYQIWPGTKVPYLTNVTVKPTSETYLIATTQDHNLMEGRALVREATLSEYADHPDFAKKMGIDSRVPENASIYKHPYTDPAEKGPEFLAPISAAPQQWGMVIDLSSCVACNACTIACQSENNIPIVGKQQVSKHRSMHWIRIDRYYSDSPDEPQIAVQPVLCQHCENAPCEAVCPVNATVHTEEGLNIIAYNRCIGTRYCANNCPYKVRRFNFFDYNARDVMGGKKIPFTNIEIPNLYLGPLGEEGSPATIQMQRNPNVSVRVRGVIEKCSFCVQRIEAARSEALVKAKDSDRTLIPVDSFKTACQVSCPAEAIVFGDIANPNSEVSKLRALDREYSLLGYLNTRPRVTYLARLRNPNPKMPGIEKIGLESDWDKFGPFSHEASTGASSS